MFYFTTIIEGAGGPTSGLFTVTTAGVVTLIDEILVGTAATNIQGIDFSNSGFLFGLDKAGNQMVQIDLAAPNTASTSVGTIDPDLHGLTSDHEGNFYSEHSGLSTSQTDEIWIRNGVRVSITWPAVAGRR